MAVDFDLLGDPIPEGWGKRGRPPHVPTDEKRRLVMQLLAFEWPVEKVASALGVTMPTLRKHYFRELKVRDDARARVEAKLLGRLMAEAEAGNVTAIRTYLQRLDRHDLSRGAGVRKPVKVRALPVGKKEAARAAAHTAHEETSWGDLIGDGKPN